MNISLISSLNNYDIFLVRDNIEEISITYYVSIPRKNDFYINLAIQLVTNIDEYNVIKNELSDLREKLNKIYSQFDQTCCAFIIPMLDNRYLTDDEANYNYIYKYFRLIIACCYNLLNGRNYEVNKKAILINNNELIEQQKRLLRDFPHQLESRTAFELSRIMPIEYIKEKKENPIEIVATAGVNFIVGSNKKREELNEGLEIKDVNVDIVETVNGIKRNDKITPPKKIIDNKSGYVSYLFLGIVCVIISFAILYILLKK